MRSYTMKIRVGILLLLTIPSGACQAQSVTMSSPLKSKAEVEQFLKKYVENSRFGKDDSTRFSLFSFPSRKLFVIYLSGHNWCGSGGCTLLMLRPNSSSLEVIGKTTTVNLPVTSLLSQHHGMPDIGVEVVGGGIQKSYRAVLLFNGVQYPRSPSSSNVKRAGANMGHVLIDKNAAGIALYR